MPTLGTATVNLKAETASFKAAMREAAATTRQTAQEMRSSMMEARGAITLLGEEVGVHLPRHLRNFVATLPGVAPLMSAAFSSIAVAGLGLVVLETAKKIYEFAKSLTELSKAEKEHHDQAVKNAKEELALQTKLVEAQYAILKAAATAPAAKQHLQLEEDRELLNLSAGYRDKMIADLAEMRKAQADAQKAARTATTSPAAMTYAPAMALGGVVAESIATNKWKEEIDQRDKDIALADAELLKSTAKTWEDQNHIAESAAKQAEAAAKKAAQAQMQGWEDAFSREKSLRVMSLDDEFAFWASRIGAAEQYAENFRKVLAKMEEYNAGAVRETETLWKEHDRLLAEDMQSLAEMSKRLNREMEEEQLSGLKRSSEETLKRAKEIHDFQMAAKAPGGDQELANMQQQLTYLNALRGTAEDTLGVEAARRNLELQIADVEMRQVLATGTALDGLKVWLAEMQVQWTSQAQQFHDVMSRAFQGIGDNLARMLVTGKANWASFFASIAEELAKLAINDLFRALLGSLSGGAGGGFLKGLASLFGGGRAGGGELDAGHFYLAGEAGPEIIGGVNGRAFDAGTSASMLSGGGANYYVDARGANAADVEARVQRALVAVHGSAVRTSYVVMQEAMRRRPLSAQNG